jgi:hypothetical protein
MSKIETPFIQNPETIGAGEKIDSLKRIESKLIQLKVLKEEASVHRDNLVEELGISYAEADNLLSLDLEKSTDYLYEYFYDKVLAREENKVESNEALGIHDFSSSEKAGLITNAIFSKIANSFEQYHLLRQKIFESFTEQDLADIKKYAMAILPEIRQTFAYISSMKKAIDTAQIGKTNSGLYSAENVSDIYSIPEDRINLHRQKLREAIRKSKIKRGMVSDQENVEDSEGVSKWRAIIKGPGRQEVLDRTKKEREQERIAANISGEELRERLGNLAKEDMLGALTNYHHETRFLFNLLNQGQIVETAYFKSIIEEAMPYLLKEPPTIVYLHGDFGSGKTALARHISKTRFNKEPIVVSGGKSVEPEKFTEEFRLSKDTPAEILNMLNEANGNESGVGDSLDFAAVIGKLGIQASDLKQKCLENIKKEVGENGEQIDSQENSNIERYVDNLIENIFKGGAQGKYALGAMYVAMATGRPLIIDEANAISPDVLIAFNDLLTKKIGDKVYVRSTDALTKKDEDGRFIEIKEGYCVIWTGNTGERYEQARFNDIDPASYSRIKPIKVEYLPNSVSATNEDLRLFEVELFSKMQFADSDAMVKFLKESKDFASSNQIFQVLLLKMMNRRLGAEVMASKEDKYSSVKELYRLSVSARIVMNLFENRTEKMSNEIFSGLQKYIESETPTVVAKKLKKANLTMRDLIDNIVGSYLDYDFAMDLEYYVFDFIKKYNLAPEDQVILYNIFVKSGFFRHENGWPDFFDTPDLKSFNSAISAYNPVKGSADGSRLPVSKYKSIDQNGDMVPMIDQKNSPMQHSYLSSLETIQILHGAFPGMSLGNYSRIESRMKKQEIKSEGNFSENKEKAEDLLTHLIDVGEIILKKSKNFTTDLKLSLGQAVSVTFESIYKIDTENENSFAKISVIVEGFCNTVLQSINNVKPINEEELKRITEMDITERLPEVLRLINEA